MIKKSGKTRLCVIALIAVTLFLSFAPVDVSADTSDNVFRAGGKDRYETSEKAADYLYKAYGRFQNVIVAQGEDFPDALSAGLLAKTKKAPILLTSPAKYDSTIDYIKSHSVAKAKVFILGSEAVVGFDFAKALESLGYQVERLGGRTRYETNLEVLEASNVKGGSLLLADAESFADSLSASSTGKPIMLVGTRLRDDQVKWIKDKGIKDFYILGGPSAVNTIVEAQLNAMGSVKRLGGKNRYETSTLISQEFFKNPSTVVLVGGHDFPDGLSGGPLAAKYNAPIVLVNQYNWNYAQDYIQSKKVTKTYVMGSEAVVPEQIVDAALEKYSAIPTVIKNQSSGTAEDMLNVMRSWLGYNEINGKFQRIIDIYNSMLPLPAGYLMRYSDEWCDACISAAAIKAGCADLIGRECGVGRHLDIFKQKGIWLEDGTIVPKPGDIIIFSYYNGTSQPNNAGASHIGIVERVINGEIVTIEGNTSESVARRWYTLGHWSIRGFARPKYATKKS